MFGSSLYFATKVSVVVSFVFFILGWLYGTQDGTNTIVSQFAVNIFFVSFSLKFFKSEERAIASGGVSFILSFIILYFQYMYVKTSSPLVFVYGQDEPGIGLLNFFILMVFSLVYFSYIASTLFFDNILLNKIYNEVSYEFFIGMKDYLYSDYTILNGLDKDYHVDFIILFTNILIHACISFWIASLFQLVKSVLIKVYKDYKKQKR